MWDGSPFKAFEQTAPANESVKPAEDPGQQRPSAPASASAGAAQPPADQRQQQGQQNEERNINDELPDEIRKLREERAAGMFGDNAQHVYRHAIPDVPDGDPKIEAEWREVMADVGASEPEARALYDTYKRELLDAGGLPDDARFAEWEKQSHDWLNRTYGAQAQEALAAGMALAKRDPRLVQWLQVTRLGSHPEIVKFAVSKAYRR